MTHKIKFLFCVLLLLLCQQRLFAENNKIDSLYQAAKSAGTLDQKMLTVSSLIYFIEGQERSQNWFDSALHLLNELEIQVKLARNDSFQAKFWFLKTNLFHSYLLLDSCIKYATMAERYYAGKGDTTGMMNCYFYLWSANRRLGHLNTALQLLFKEKEIRELRKDTAGILDSYNKLGIVYLNKENEPEKILEALFMAKKYGLAIDTFNFMSIAEAYILLNMPDSAAYYLRFCSHFAHDESLYGPPYYFKALGRYYKYIGYFDSAKICFFNAISGLEKVRQFHNQSRCYYFLGEISFQQNELDNSEEYYRSAEQISKKYIYSELPAIYLALNKLYERQGRMADAYQTLKDFQMVNDSLNKTEAIDITLANSIKHEFSLQQEASKREILSKEYERKALVRRQREMIIGATAIILFLSVFSIYVLRSRRLIFREKQRSDGLLLNILPEEIANELKRNGHSEARDFEMVSIIFTDFKNFTETAATMNAKELVNEINYCFEAFDHILEKYGIEKIKTIGDAYMAASGLPIPTNASAKCSILAALDMQQFIAQHKSLNEAKGIPYFEMRAGIHTGPVVAGIVGVKKFQYDVWGDTVNTASRMESSGAPGKVNISAATYELVKNEPQFSFEFRGKIEVKGKGELEMWFVSKSHPANAQVVS